MEDIEKVGIIDFGSQYTQLIARRLRELGVYSEIYSPDDVEQVLNSRSLKGLILSGGPQEAHVDAQHLTVHQSETHIPILGICYGMQLLSVVSGGKVSSTHTREYGLQSVDLQIEDPLFRDLRADEQVWMSHGDSVTELGKGWETVARSGDGTVAAIRHKVRPQYGLQFHPEVTHTCSGERILSNFLDLCTCKRDWNAGCYITQAKEKIRKQVGTGRVISLVSGGVDSTVATLLCVEALGAEAVYPVYIDTGLMRAGETEQVRELLTSHGMDNLVCVDAKEEFLTALTGIADPEKKRTIIGDLFIKVLEREVAKLHGDSKDTFFCQGTLYTDLIESGHGCGKQAAVIKSHHNVNPPIIRAKREAGLIVEPNSGLFKDEVRRVAETLGVPHALAWRHPFPGPGLGIRVLGEVTPERVATLQQADKIYLEEIHAAGLYNAIWQAFAVLLPVQTVGVMGDKRTYGYVVALRAVTSQDGMTAEVFDFPHDVLGRISTRIVNEVDAVNRVVYDTTSKPPGTIEWE